MAERRNSIIMHPTIKVDPRDNVAIVVEAAGLKAGNRTSDNIVLVEDVPQGHKVALVDLAKDEPIIRYGEVIGFATEPISKGSWINESIVRIPRAKSLDDITISGRAKPDMEPLTGYSFEGYCNKDGSVGTRNILGITTSVQCVSPVAAYAVRRIKEELLPFYPNVDDVIALNHAYGCGVAVDAPAAVIPIRTLQNLALNPNLGGEVLVLGLGCEKLLPQRLLPENCDPCL